MKRVVVTGMGIISPVGNTIENFWGEVKAGRHGIGEITRFDTSDFKVKIAAEVKGFDPVNYMDKSDARRMDLFTQYAVAASVMAEEMSGIVGQVAPERLGVYIGSGVGGMQTFTNEVGKLNDKGAKWVSPLFVPMMIANMASGAVAIRFNAQGINLPVVTACATSTNAIGEAYRAIRGGYADAVFAGGAEAPIIPVSVAGFTNCLALSARNQPDCASIPFDKRRDGFVMGEGAAVLVLEEYSHALKRGANILGEIKGYGNFCDAYHITAPHPEGAGGMRALAAALDEAGFCREDCSKLYINAHGTSTPLNDRAETQVIKGVLGQEAYRASISSTKSVTGHMLGAAGGAEAIVSLLALRDNIVPPTAGYLEAEEGLDLDYTPNTAKAKPLESAVSISLGFGGHNAAVAFGRVE